MRLWVILGSESGPIVLPGDWAKCLLVHVQGIGKHFAHINTEELRLVKKWIDEGSPEKYGQSLKRYEDIRTPTEARMSVLNVNSLFSKYN